jgi:hypothetical protein
VGAPTGYTGYTGYTDCTHTHTRAHTQTAYLLHFTQTCDPCTLPVQDTAIVTTPEIAPSGPMPLVRQGVSTAGALYPPHPPLESLPLCPSLVSRLTPAHPPPPPPPSLSRFHLPLPERSFGLGGSWWGGALLTLSPTRAQLRPQVFAGILTRNDSLRRPQPGEYFSIQVHETARAAQNSYSQASF